MIELSVQLFTIGYAEHESSVHLRGFNRLLGDVSFGLGSSDINGTLGPLHQFGTELFCIPSLSNRDCGIIIMIPRSSNVNAIIYGRHIELFYL
jgi:hypothetical protein